MRKRDEILKLGQKPDDANYDKEWFDYLTKAMDEDKDFQETREKLIPGRDPTLEFWDCRDHWRLWASQQVSRMCEHIPPGMPSNEELWQLREKVEHDKSGYKPEDHVRNRTKPVDSPMVRSMSPGLDRAASPAEGHGSF